ncbi:transposase-like protein [Streptomyces sp. TE5632]
MDQHGNVRDILVRPKRDTRAAVRFFRRLPKSPECVPRVVVTARLRSYGAAHRQAMPGVEHRTSKYLNNRAENPHRPTRRRERTMKGFRSAGAAPRSLSAFIRPTQPTK